MNTIGIIFLVHFGIGFILGFVACHVMTKEYGEGEPIAVFMVFMCCLFAWEIAFPDQMSEVAKDRKERKNKPKED